MDDEAALLERQLAMAASACRQAKADTEAYRHFVAATDEWDGYAAPATRKARRGTARPAGA